jgi:hypothetical protein
MGEMKNAYTIIVAELKTRDNFGHLCTHGKIQTSDKVHFKKVHKDLGCVHLAKDRAKLT